MVFERYFEGRAFPIKEFLNELDKKEIVFLSLLNVSEDSDIIEYIADTTDDINDFFKRLDKDIVNHLSKQPKEELTFLLSGLYGKDFLNKVIYQSLYTLAYKDEEIVFNSSMLALERFSSIIFNKKRKMLEEALSSGKLDKSDDTAIEEFKKRFLFANKPVLNTLWLTIALGRINVIKPFFGSSMKKFGNELFILLLEQFEEIGKAQHEALLHKLKKQELNYTNLENQLKKKNESATKLKDNLKQVNEELKKVRKELKNENKDKVDISVVNELNQKIKAHEEVLKAYKEEVLKDKAKVKEDYEKKIKTIENELLEVKRTKKSDIRQLNTTIEELKLKSKLNEELIADYLRNNGLSNKLLEIIKSYLPDVYSQEEKVAQEESETVNNTKIEQKVGYCLIENDIHYAVFPDGSRIEIIDIPETLYLAEWQFVKVTKFGQFKWGYNYKFETSDWDYNIHEFGSIIYKQNEPYYMKGVWDTRKIEYIPANTYLKEGHVISVNRKAELIRYYRSFKPTADNCLASIRAKGQVAYYVLKVFPNGLLVRNIETKQEEFKIIETNGVAIEEQQMICVKDDVLIYVYYQSKFYTLSTLYKKAEMGTVEILKDSVFVRKLSGELVLLNEIPANVNLLNGDIIRIDEFNNFLESTQEVQSELTEERRKLIASNNKVSTVKKGYNERIELSKEVLVVGNISYENSYKMAFFKHGYRAEVIDGYEPWTKIKSATKGKDIVVVISDFISHDNMWNIKEEVKTIPIIYPEYDGANRIVEEVQLVTMRNES